MGNAAAGWTPQRRQRQREAIQRRKPWLRSTGPVSPEGKAVVARNAYAGGLLAPLRAAVSDLHKAMREQRRLL